MKLLLSFIFLQLVCPVFGHQFYFSFAEMQYNKELERLEVSIRATGHDVEAFLKSKGEELPSLENCIGNPVAEQVIENYLLKYFQVKINDKPINFTLIGLEVNIKDEVVFYLKSNQLIKPEAIEIKYDLLMDHFPDQQNKLTIFTEKGKDYLGFLPHRRTRIYEYEKNE